MTIPAWLTEHIRTTTGRHPGDRNAQPTKCRQCKATILRGLDEDVCAFTARVDPNPLSALGEALALLADRRTYKLTRHGSRYRLTRRGADQIRAKVTFWPGDVVTDHACHCPGLPGVPSVFVPAPHLAPAAAEITITDQEGRDDDRG